MKRMTDLTVGQAVRDLRARRKSEWDEAESRDVKLQAARQVIRREPPRERRDELAAAGIDWLGRA